METQKGYLVNIQVLRKARENLPQVDIYVNGKPLSSYTPRELEKLGVEINKLNITRTTSIITTTSLISTINQEPKGRS